jgi:hypothetical protein
MLPGVDLEYTTTNQILEIYETFGIDAVCYAIESNLVDVMVASSANVSKKHIQLIANMMCLSGKPCALTFIGMSKQMSQFKLATFERALDSFVSAGVIGLRDDLKGTSESIVAGTKMSIGTGGSFLLRNMPRISKESTKLPPVRPMLLRTVPILPIPADTVLQRRLRMSSVPIVPSNRKQRKNRSMNAVSDVFPVKEKQKKPKAEKKPKKPKKEPKKKQKKLKDAIFEEPPVKKQCLSIDLECMNYDYAISKTP